MAGDTYPAAKQWKGYEEALAAYGVAICREWCRRGHADTCDVKIRQELSKLGIATVREQADLAKAGASRLGSATRASTEATGRRFSTRTPSGTATSSPTCRPISPTSGPASSLSSLGRAFGAAKDDPAAPGAGRIGL